MHPTIPPAITGAPTRQKIDMPSNGANQPRLKFVVSYREAANRKQKVFETEEEAIEFARTKNPNFRRDIQDQKAQEVAHILLDCANRLSAHGKTVKEATDFFIQHLIANEKSCTAGKLVDEFVAAMQKDPPPLPVDSAELRSRLTTFGERFGSYSVTAITGAEIDDWLRSLNVSVVTRNRYRRLIMLAFNFAVQRGYANSNPVLGRFVVSRPA